MIVFEKIRYKNFMAAGNSPIEILLNKSKTTLIVGANGHGKSSVLEALTFSLFGKPFRDIKKAQLINSINGKQCLVEVWFSCGSKKYYIKRGIKPDVFEIYCDDKLLDQLASVRDYQLLLEDQILGMNQKTFMQIFLLSVSNFKPFMQLEAKDRREIIEEILDIKVFSDMNVVLKERMSKLKEHIRDVESSIDVQRQKIEVQKKYVATLCDDRMEKEKSLQEDIKLADAKITALEEEITLYTNKIVELQETIQDEPLVVAKREKLVPLTYPLRSKLESLKETIEFYSDATSCPTCLQEIGEDVKRDQIQINTKKIDDIQIAIKKLQDQLGTLSERENEISEVKKQIREVNQQIQQTNSSIIAEQNYIKRLNTEINNLSSSTGSIDTEKEKIKELADAAMEFVRQKSELNEKKQYYDIAASLLKDSGIKTKIIDQYIPVINKLINKYLDLLGVWINFTLDSEFNETIKSRHRDSFTYSSFSEGEKQRIDLAILFTWRTIAKMKNSVSCSLLFMDEIADKALDLAGIDDFTKLLDSLGDGTNVFVISHKQELLDKFHSVIKFEKVNNFSQIAATN